MGMEIAIGTVLELNDLAKERRSFAAAAAATLHFTNLARPRPFTGRGAT